MIYQLRFISHTLPLLAGQSRSCTVSLLPSLIGTLFYSLLTIYSPPCTVNLHHMFCSSLHVQSPSCTAPFIYSRRVQSPLCTVSFMYCPVHIQPFSCMYNQVSKVKGQFPIYSQNLRKWHFSKILFPRRSVSPYQSQPNRRCKEKPRSKLLQPTDLDVSLTNPIRILYQSPIEKFK